MTSDGDALFRAICENPQEDTPRLIYADWLDENGDTERAEFIRLQIEARVLDPAYPAPDAIVRVTRLLREYGNAWRAELPQIAGVCWNPFFVRGFIEHADLTAEKDSSAHLTQAFAAAPLSRLVLHALNEERLLTLLDHPCVPRLARLAMPDLAVHRLSDEAREKLREVERRLPDTRLLYNRR
jgi:uncharacterized protein (TIGR02996 family)